MRYSVLYLGILSGLFMCCGRSSEGSESHSSAKDTVNITDFNIVIAPDLSNRLNRQLYPKPVLDDEIIRLILAKYPDHIAKFHRVDGQKDIIRVGFINEIQVSHYNVSPSDMQIDLSVFEKQIDRIEYLKGRKDKSFAKDTTRFVNAFQSLTIRAQAEEFGSDIWSYFAKLDDYWIHNQQSVSSFANKIYRHSYRNVLILLTDGYIEAGVYKNGGCPIDPKSCMFLSKRRVDDFRDAFRKSGQKDLTAFFERSEFEILPVRNTHLKNLEVLVLELQDRSLAKGGIPTKYPTDIDILFLFWSKWLADSGVSRFQIEPAFTSKEEAQETILGFILR